MLSLALLFTNAWAQEARNSDFDCSAASLLEGPSKQLALQAANDNATLYGAVGTAERELLPRMHENEGMKVFVWEQRVLAGALHAPATGYACADETLYAPIDLTSSNWGLAFSTDDVGVFYNASVTISSAHGSGFQRGVLDALYSGLGLFYGLAAPFVGSEVHVEDASVWQVDYIAGIEATPGSVALHAGYVGSKGAYLHFAEKHSGAFFGGAANRAFQEIPYLRGGIERLAIPQLQDKIGRSSLFGRKLQLPRSPGTTGPGPSFLTGHVAQEDIAGRFDLWAALEVKPDTTLQELRVGVHTEGFSLSEDAREGQGFRATAGMIRMPQDLAIDVEGGPRFSGSLEYGYRTHWRGEVNLIEASLRFNDPDVLVMFPYAENALNLYFLLSFAMR